MAERSFKSLGSSALDLDQASKERLLDSEILFASGRYASAVAMGIYALEIRLKERICFKLNLLNLPKPFEIHDLDGLLILSGLSQLMKTDENRLIKIQWEKIVEAGSSLNDLRYKPGDRWSKDLAEETLKMISNPQDGVLSWISNQK